MRASKFDSALFALYRIYAVEKYLKPISHEKLDVAKNGLIRQSVRSAEIHGGT